MATTFGYQTTPAGACSHNRNDIIIGGPFTCADTALGLKITMLHGNEGANVKCALYDGSFNFIASTEERLLPDTGADTCVTWEDFDFSPHVKLTAGATYYLAAWAEGPSFSKIGTRKVTGQGYTNYFHALTYTAEWPATLPAASATNTYSDWINLMYLTYVTYANATEEQCKAAGCYWYNDTCNSAPFFYEETYISGYLSRYQKRQMIGYFPSSGELRGVTVNASGHLYTDVTVSVSGMDIEVNISGDPVIISGQPVTISGDHVFVESGISRLHGYHPASGIWVPIAVTLSGCLAMTYCSSGGIFG